MVENSHTFTSPPRCPFTAKEPAYHLVAQSTPTSPAKPEMPALPPIHHTIRVTSLARSYTNGPTSHPSWFATPVNRDTPLHPITSYNSPTTDRRTATYCPRLVPKI
ncbi:hypothetical protein C8J57DRAFT_1523054 [Mycena rebaudengoi]|nr:hypothetical protein C8J57DRAFT_1523054 [Mycena rebaudengoi]